MSTPSHHPTLATAHVLASVARERARQEELKAAGRFAHTLADPDLLDAERYVILDREMGEVSRAVHIPATDRRPELLAGQNTAALRAELVQVAALAVAWIESIDASELARGAE